jgi:Uma2 family endonuclease
MTVEAPEFVRWTPDPMRQRLADYTVEDVLLLSGDAPRCELTDGVITTVPLPTVLHQAVATSLRGWFEARLATGAHAVSTGVGVIMTHKDTLEPDLVVHRRPAYDDHHYVDPSQVLIAVEIVAPGTRRRDRLEKPSLYASAGIAHFWRVEMDPVHVHAYQLVDGRYERAGDSDEVLRLSKPFDVELSIRDITP